jgi:hypothetical protein
MRKLALLIVVPFLMAAQPGAIPLTVNMPNALTTNTQFVWDGGSGSAPSVTIFPVLAPSYHVLSGGIVAAEAGFDGGAVPGVLKHERLSLVSLTMPTFTNLNNLFNGLPECTCAQTSGTSIVKTCVAQQDAGATLGPTADGGPVTTVVIDTVGEDGGTYTIDCLGY